MGWLPFSDNGPACDLGSIPKSLPFSYFITVLVNYMNNLKGSRVYIAGPIQYQNDLGKSWRIKITKELQSIGIGVINPLDKPTDHNEDEDFRQQLKTTEKFGRIYESDPNDSRLFAEELKHLLKPIVAIDLRFVDVSDFLIAYVHKDIHTAGTYAEITHALLQRKPVILFNESSIYDIPLWWFGHADYKLFFNSLDKAIQYIKDINDGKNVYLPKSWKLINYRKIFGE